MEQTVDGMCLDERPGRDDEMQIQISPCPVKRKITFEEDDSEDVFEVVSRIKRIKFPVYILFKTLNGRSFVLDFDSNDTLEVMKELIAEHEGIPSDHQRLIFNGQQMQELNRPVRSYGVSDGSTIYLLLALPHRRGFSGISAEHRTNMS
jgi:hypothetical protein